jgi:hypothetical protein
MPWQAILGGATGGLAVVIVIAVIFIKSLTEKLIDGAGKRFESALKRSEELQRSTLALATAVDTDLRQHRVGVYADLWKKTGALPRWPRNSELTYQDLRDLTADLRSWFFNSGGMFLSAKAREAYGEVQESLTSVLKNNKDGRVRVAEVDYDAILAKCSALRAELTHDLLSRREAPTL